jgi:hypothetical protein
MWVTWVLTVAAEIVSSRPISALVRPSPKSVRTSSSRLLSVRERICEPNAAQRLGRRATQRAGVDGLHSLTCIFETCDATCLSHRLAHNPEVAGSNPVPATSRNGPWRRLRGPFSCPMGALLGTLATVTDYVRTDSEHRRPPRVGVESTVRQTGGTSGGSRHDTQIKRNSVSASKM